MTVKNDLIKIILYLLKMNPYTFEIHFLPNIIKILLRILA